MRRNIKKVWTEIVEKKKSTGASKTETTRQHQARMVDMQRYVDMSEEKRAELIKVLKSRASDCDMTIVEKGVLIYTRLLEVADTLKSDIEKEGYTCYLITSAQSQKVRSEIVETFKKDSSNTVIIISDAGGESVSLQATNEIIMYNVPRGPGRWTQVLGRVARMFSKYDGFNVHFIMVEDSIDEYSQILLSAKKELEEEILSADTIPLREEKSFNNLLLKKIRQGLLWKKGRTKKNPKLN